MASACIRTMNLGQNSLPSLQNQNYILISNPQNYNQPSNQQSMQLPSLNSSSITSKILPAIAPAPPSNNNNHRVNIINNSTSSTTILGMNGINMQSQPISTGGGAIYKKKYTYANIPYGAEQPPSVVRRNARERNRVKQVNNGFANLRQHIPQTIITALTNGGRGASKKLSKVDTLRLAVEYIRRLKDVVDDADGISDTNSNYNSATSLAGSPGPSSFYSSSDSPDNIHQGFMLAPGGYSDASVSPAPSYGSDISIGSNNYLPNSQSPNLSQPVDHHNQFKFEPYDNYSSITDTTPEDEELLDYISSWQEQQ